VKFTHRSRRDLFMDSYWTVKSTIKAVDQKKYPIEVLVHFIRMRA